MASPAVATSCSTRTKRVRILLDQAALAAQPIGARAQCGEANTEELRPAVVQFRALLDGHLGVTAVTDPVTPLMKTGART